MPSIHFQMNISRAFTAMADRLRDRLARGMQAVLPHIRDVWARALLGAKKTGQVSAYTATLMRPDTIEYPVHGDVLRGRVTLQEEQAQRKKGLAWDMKPSLLSGPKARRNKKGQKYNVIPLGRNEALWLQGVDYRTVSEKSPPGSWWYPAQPMVEEGDIREQVRVEIMPTVRQLLIDALRGR